MSQEAKCVRPSGTAAAADGGSREGITRELGCSAAAAADNVYVPAVFCISRYSAPQLRNLCLVFPIHSLARIQASDRN